VSGPTGTVTSPPSSLVVSSLSDVSLLLVISVGSERGQTTCLPRHTCPLWLSD